MKVYALPEEVPAPQLDYLKLSLKEIGDAQKEHSAKLKEHLIGLGYTGANTGRILYISHADGAAAYMYAEVKGGSCLIHLPYGDGWDSPWSRSITQKEALARIAQQENRPSIFDR